MDYAAKQAARNAAAAELQAANPHLIAAGDHLTTAAKNLRIELRRAFPGVKFSVKTSRYSGGNSMTASWTDGPTSQQVDEIADRYQGQDFDGMTDSTSIRSNAWIDAFGHAGYVFCTRHYSDAGIASGIRTACRKWGAPTATVEQYHKGELRSIRQANFGHFDLGDLVHQELSRRTWALNRSEAA